MRPLVIAVALVDPSPGAASGLPACSGSRCGRPPPGLRSAARAWTSTGTTPAPSPTSAASPGSSSLPAGVAVVRVSAPGFRPVQASIDIASSEAVLHVALAPVELRVDESVIVSAARADRAASDVPRSTAVVSRTALDERADRTSPEALQDRSGGWVQKTNHGGGSPIVRGLVGNQVLVLIDGVRLNNATFRLGPNQYMNTIDAFSLERIEVLRGSGSVQYGSDALGGVVNLISPLPVLSSGGLRAGGAVATRLVSSGMEQTARAEGQRRRLARRGARRRHPPQLRRPRCRRVSRHRSAVGLSGVQRRRLGDLGAVSAHHLHGCLSVRLPGGGAAVRPGRAARIRRVRIRSAVPAPRLRPVAAACVLHAGWISPG